MPRERSDRGAEREAQQLEPVDGHPHHLGRERVLAERAPRATRAGEVHEAQQDVDDDEERERDVEVGDVEDAALARDGDRVPEEAERVDVEQAVGAARDVVTEEVVAVRRHGEEQLQEEERHDREVVTGQPARRQSDQEADDGADHDDGRDRDDRGQVDAVVVGAQERIRVGADPVERDEAEVEQATPADDDVEPEREQHVDGDVECDPPDVAVVGDDGNEARRGTNSVSQAHHGTRRSRSSIAPRGPPRWERLSPCRATHSSRPTAGLVGPSDVVASIAPSSGRVSSSS